MYISDNYDIESFDREMEEDYDSLDENIEELETDCNGRCFSDADPGL
jgi:hypothetical protein